MRIGYSVEGSTDRALINRLGQLWCPDALLEEGHFRGSLRMSVKREIRKIVTELAMKSVDVVVILRDADEERWQDVKRDIIAAVPQGRTEILIVGVPDRNVESWICSEATYASEALGINVASLNVPNPKGVFERALGITRDDKKEEQIAQLVANAPLDRWIAEPSFRDFYEQARDMSQRLGCEIPNLYERA